MNDLNKKRIAWLEEMDEFFLNAHREELAEEAKSNGIKSTKQLVTTFVQQDAKPSANNNCPYCGEFAGMNHGIICQPKAVECEPCDAYHLPGQHTCPCGDPSRINHSIVCKPKRIPWRQRERTLAKSMEKPKINHQKCDPGGLFGLAFGSLAIFTVLTILFPPLFGVGIVLSAVLLILCEYTKLGCGKHGPKKPNQINPVNTHYDWFNNKPCHCRMCEDMEDQATEMVHDCNKHEPYEHTLSQDVDNS